MKSKISVSFIILSLAATLTLAQAQDGPGDRSFGIGAQVTSPAGVSMKGWISDNAAIASVVSFQLSENNSLFYIHADYLLHKHYDTPDWDIGALSYYYGVGGRYIWREVGFDDSFFAVRLPGGFNFNFVDIPVDIYIELAPTLEVSPDFSFGFNGGIGFRYFLN